MFDPSRDFVRDYEEHLRRQSQEQTDRGGRPREHRSNPLPRRRRITSRQLLIRLGLMIVLVIVLYVLLGGGATPSGS